MRATIAEIERLKDADPNYWRIYGLGERGVNQAAVFTWEVGEIAGKRIGTGLDFGFTNDPTAVIDVYLDGHTLILHERLYSTGLTNPDIGEELDKLDVETIIADSAEPKSIEELFRLGHNVKPARKGPDSIRQGIDIMRRHKLLVTAESTNLQKELRAYRWEQDKNGRNLNRPVDKDNHGIDAVRYVCLNSAHHKPEREIFHIVKKTITIPEDLYDITVRQYRAIQAIPEGDEFRQVVETICILCDLTTEEVMAMEQKDIQHIGGVIGGILDKYDDDYPVERIIDLDQRYGFHPNLSRITVAEFADIETLCKDSMDDPPAPGHGHPLPPHRRGAWRILPDSRLRRRRPQRILPRDEDGPRIGCSRFFFAYREGVSRRFGQLFQGGERIQIIREIRMVRHVRTSRRGGHY